MSSSSFIELLKFRHELKFALCSSAPIFITNRKLNFAQNADTTLLLHNMNYVIQKKKNPNKQT